MLGTALNAKKTEQQGLDAALNAKEVERQRLEAALTVKEAERQQLETALNVKEAERQQLETVLNVKESERLGLDATLNSKEVERQQLEAALNAKEAELENVQLNRDQIFAELIGVYHSRSFRLTLPMRLTFIAARKWRNKLNGSQDQPELAAPGGQADKISSSRRMVDNLRKIPWIAILLDKLKHRYPRLWYKIARRIKQSTRVQPEPLPYMQMALSDPLALNADESRFLKLFERELSRRQAINMETK